jgi:hypothetical protein
VAADAARLVDHLRPAGLLLPRVAAAGRDLFRHQDSFRAGAPSMRASRCGEESRSMFPPDEVSSVKLSVKNASTL